MINSAITAHPGKNQATKRASRTPTQNAWLEPADPTTEACWLAVARINPPINRTFALDAPVHARIGKS